MECTVLPNDFSGANILESDNNQLVYMIAYVNKIKSLKSLILYVRSI